jgi:hypothetical protein
MMATKEELLRRADTYAKRHGLAPGERSSPRSRLVVDRTWKSTDNLNMQIPGRVENGVVVFDGDASLPEGTRVVVFQLSPGEQATRTNKKRVELPLVKSGTPGSIHLTNERIQEILDEEDIAALKRSWNASS